VSSDRENRELAGNFISTRKIREIAGNFSTNREFPKSESNCPKKTQQVLKFLKSKNKQNKKKLI